MKEGASAPGHDPKRIVQRGYDQLGDAYRIFYERANPDRYRDWLTDFATRLPAGGKVLELGCADGIPAARYLSQQFDYVGIDLSPVQVELARQNVPGACFEVADMATVAFSEAAFDGVLALYSIIHLPPPEQPDLFRAIYRWLKPNGYFLGVVGAGEWTGTGQGWIIPELDMYWSHTDAASYQMWFTEIGFSVLDTYFVPEGDSGHTFFLLGKPSR